MNEFSGVADLEQRRRALDPQRSFIVQAPAGSGKTELLIQRYLVLLSRVDSPEEIAAITFTRRAAAEMRKRVLDALAWARSHDAPREPHRALTWEHARAAIERDRALGWKLQDNAARLRIQTIDALCASLTRQMPVLATFGAQPQSIEDAHAHYLEAASATLALLEDKAERQGHAADVERLLAHLDNDADTARRLIAGMLEKRDHWLRNLRSADDRATLERALAGVRRESMARARLLVPAQEAVELLALAGYAAENLAVDGVESPIRECADLAALPGTGDADLYAWLGVADVLLNSAGEWRKTVNVKQGFPAATDGAGKARTAAREWKRRHAAMVGRLAGAEGLRAALDALRCLPPARYMDAQWEALGAITRLLPRAVAELKLVFAARGEADFVEIAQGALAALGQADGPTDLMLALDCRIRHILVDEFQDTSFTQFELLEKLTAGWGTPGQHDDDRTLFLVGDPMQSIYRFREAQVGLFLKAQTQGIGQVALEPLRLSANFRSQADIVDWVNHAFVEVMPHAEDAGTGAVPYSPSEPVHDAEGDAVHVHVFFNGDAQGEAARVAALVEAARTTDPAGTVAVLVRSRGHLATIVPSLKARGLRFRAIEIERLGHRQVVQDLLALTRALLHPGDRVAWLAVLRAPWCGLTLADLHALVGAPRFASEVNAGGGRASVQHDLFAALEAPTARTPDPVVEPDGRTVWELLRDNARVERLSADARARTGRVRDILGYVMLNRQRGSLREGVESTWLALGGPACVENGNDLEDAETYLDFLEKSEAAGEITDLAAFEEGLAKLYALPDLQADPQTAVQIMTIHKAKGLEFDTVIIPGLGRVPRRRDPSLFLWTERPVSSHVAAPADPADGAIAQLLLAPIKEAGTDADRIYDYLVRLEAEKESHEDGRLLYVAATRARKHLHLLGDTRLVSTDDGNFGVRLPSAASLLAKLWPAVEPEFTASARAAARRTGEHAPVHEASEINQDLRRLPSGWPLPEAPPAVRWHAPHHAAPSQDAIEFSWAGETARHVGSVVHRWLQHIADDEMKGWNSARIEKMNNTFRDELAARGVQEQDLAAATERVARALSNSLDDPRGKWLLGPQRQARNEYRLTAIVEGEPQEFVVDRTFSDSEGSRWIVDYKTSAHEGTDIDAFLDRERARYAHQLERYARALGGEGHVALGLYFPLLCGWRDWKNFIEGSR